MKELAKEIKNFENREALANQKNPPKAPAVYCYNTLGTVTCYEKPRQNEESRYIGSTVEPIDPEINANHIRGDVELPAPKIDDGGVVNPATDPGTITNEITDTTASVLQKETPSITMPAPAIQPTPTVPVVQEQPANKPLSPDALRPKEIQASPMENKAEPIVPPKVKKKSVKKQNKPKPKPAPTDQPAQQPSAEPIQVP